MNESNNMDEFVFEQRRQDGDKIIVKIHGCDVYETRLHYGKLVSQVDFYMYGLPSALFLHDTRKELEDQVRNFLHERGFIR